MYTIGLRRLAAAPLRCDTEALLLYGPALPLCGCAALSRKGAAEHARFFGLSGQVRAAGSIAVAPEFELTMDSPNPEALKLMLSGAYFSLFYEALGVGDGDAPGVAVRAGRVYKCRARLSHSTLTGFSANPKVSPVTLALTACETLHQANGAGLIEDWGEFECLD